MECPYSDAILSIGSVWQIHRSIRFCSLTLDWFLAPMMQMFFTCRRSRIGVALGSVVLLASMLQAMPASAGLKFDFDYTYDANGLFDDPARRDAMEMAGHLVNWYVDNLAALIPEGDNGWYAFLTKPDGTGMDLIEEVPIAQDTMLVYVGGKPLNEQLAVAVALRPVATLESDPDWTELVAHRGQPGSADDPASDFGAVGGSITFDTGETNWHFDISTRDLRANQFDFITVAMHELLHLMGMGVSKSFRDQTNEFGEFLGVNAVAAGSSTNPDLALDEFDFHWQSGTKSLWNGRVQEALNAPGIYPGRRAYPTELDRAALIDVGWEAAVAGDANLDRHFNTDDFVEIFIQGKYNTGEVAAWADGDWDDDALFTSDDIVFAFQEGHFEGSPSAVDALLESGQHNVSDELLVTYDALTGDVHVDSLGKPLSVLQIVSASQVLRGSQQDLWGPFELDQADRLLKLDVTGFSSVAFDELLPVGMSGTQLVEDLSFDGAWVAGGGPTDVRISLVPEPSGFALLLLGWLVVSRMPRFSHPRCC